MADSKFASFFGGAQNDTESIEYKESVQIGELLSEKGYTIINGGYRGLMEAVSLGASLKKGTSIGITCNSFGDYSGNMYLTHTCPANNIYERLFNLIEDSSLFIAHRGGIGTLSEIFLTLDVIRKKSKKDRPKFFLFGEYWNQMSYSILSLIPEKERHLLIFVKDIKHLKQYL